MFELYNLFLFLCFFLVFIWTKTDEKNENCIWNICVVNTSWSVPNSWLITGFVTRLTRRMPLVERELPTLPEHLSSCPVFSGVRVARSLVLCVCFVDRCLSFCIFSFGHCVVCHSIFWFWLPLWYLQTLLIIVGASTSFLILYCQFNVENKGK
jgi:hypothetical protein